jgi:SAM-dependent methyltransferase
LEALVGRLQPPVPWQDGDNLPWDKSGFSKRMLEEHLSQEHDLASRREVIIDAQVVALGDLLPEERSARILDLGCGPGLYLHRFAREGHRCHGIDFAPASIAHARAVASAENLDCTFDETDLRSADFGEGYDLVLLVYGQINVFSRHEARGILERAYGALKPGGRLVLEPQEPEAVRGSGSRESDWSTAKHGLFSPRSHLLLHERFWDDSTRTATDRWTVIDAETETSETYAMSTCAYDRHELGSLLESIGFLDVEIRSSFTADAATSEEGLFVVIGLRGSDTG